MPKPGLINTLKSRRERAGLSQQALAERSGTTRQAVIAIERSKQVPSTQLALTLARALGCSVDDLFRLAQPDVVEARAPDDRENRAGTRAVMGRVRGRWVAHPIPPTRALAADGLLQGDANDGQRVQLLTDPGRIESNVLVAGCAPLLGMLLDRISVRYADARGTWLPANSARALDLLEAGLVHVAGLHLFDEVSGEHNTPIVRARFASERMHVITLTRWRQGLIVAPDNPLGLQRAEELLRPTLRAVRREPGSGTAKLVQRLLGDEGARRASDLSAYDHEQVAQSVRLGVADVGVGIESVALAAGLGFVPLAQERFDLVVSDELADVLAVRRFMDAINDLGFRMELRGVPGYDTAACGQVTTLDAA
jgi:molybdate-binding protein/DNA-binding XRE family transcriptional regulator